MSAGRAVQTFGLQVPAGDEPTPIVEFGDYPATIRLTMAALDPTEKTEGANADDFKGAVLRIIRIPEEDEDDEDDEDDYEDDMAHLLDEEDSEEDDDEEDDAKTSKASKVAALKAAINGDGMDVDSAAPKGKKSKKEAKKELAVTAEDNEDDDDDDEDDDEDDMDAFDDDLPAPEEYVLCTLDTKQVSRLGHLRAYSQALTPLQHYQQTLDITIDERETVFFQVSGTHTVYLTGNIIMPDADDYDDSDDEDDEDDSDYDQSPDEDEIDMLDEDISDEEDALDTLDNPRVTEVDDEEAEAPVLVAAPAKGKNKRAAEDDSMVDASMASATSAASATDGDKLSKSQKKKLAKKQKDNEGNAVAPAAAAATKTEPAAAKTDKKTVQFKEGLVQGPTPSGTSTDAKSTTTSGPRTVSGVTLDDRKIGSGPAAKKGDRVSMRYIGKLDKTKAVFDSNKKGKPFSFVLGKGEVIKGWDIGVAGMQAGGERRLTIPAGLAYGSQKQAGIPANSTLVFDVKLLEIK